MNENISTITIDAIINDIRKALIKEDSRDVPGLTFDEIRNRMRIGERRARRILRDLVQSGDLACSPRKIVDVSGRVNQTYVYYIPDSK